MFQEIVELAEHLRFVYAELFISPPREALAEWGYFNRSLFTRLVRHPPTGGGVTDEVKKEILLSLNRGFGRGEIQA